MSRRDGRTCDSAPEGAFVAAHETDAMAQETATDLERRLAQAQRALGAAGAATDEVLRVISNFSGELEPRIPSHAGECVSALRTQVRRALPRLHFAEELRREPWVKINPGATLGRVAEPMAGARLH